MNKKGLLLVFATAIISGFSIFINKYGISFSSPYIFTFLKNVTVAMFLLSLIIVTKDFSSLKKRSFRQWIMLLCIGLIGGSIPFLLFFKGLTLTSAAQGSFLQKTMFIYTAMLAVIFLKEKINKGFLIGAISLMLGNLLILKNMNFSFGVGDLMILGATVFWAIENVISKYALKSLDGKTVAWGRMFFGSIFILIFLVISGQIRGIASIDLHQIGWIGITSVLLFGYVMTWYSGLKLVPVSVATAILILGAPITTALSAVSGGKIGWHDLLSIIFILLGIISIIGADLFSRSIKQYAKKLVRT